MIFRFFPRMRLSPITGTHTWIIRKASSGGKKDPESGSEKSSGKGIRVLGGTSEKRRKKMLADWLRTRRVDSVSGKKKAKGVAVAAALAGRAQFDATAQITTRVYRDLKKPVASG